MTPRDGWTELRSARVGAWKRLVATRRVARNGWALFWACQDKDWNTQISTADARTGPDTQRAQAHNHTQNSNPRTHPRQTAPQTNLTFTLVHTHTHTSRGERCQSTVWWWGSCVNLERPPPASRYHLGLAQGSKDSESSREATKSPRCFCLLKPLFDRDCLTVYAKIIYRSTMDPTRTDRKRHDFLSYPPHGIQSLP